MNINPSSATKYLPFSLLITRRGERGGYVVAEAASFQIHCHAFQPCFHTSHTFFFFATRPHHSHSLYPLLHPFVALLSLGSGLSWADAGGGEEGNFVHPEASCRIRSMDGQGGVMLIYIYPNTNTTATLSYFYLNILWVMPIWSMLLPVGRYLRENYTSGIQV